MCVCVCVDCREMERIRVCVDCREMKSIRVCMRERESVCVCRL